MSNIEEFYTLKGYKLKEKNNISDAMEDYLEMIYRCKDEVTVKKLSENLNVRPSSVSKMINKLKDEGFIEYEKYGKIILTEDGLKLGSYLLYRHLVLRDFLRYINKDDYNLEQVEKIEHFIDDITIQNIEKFLKKNKE